MTVIYGTPFGKQRPKFVRMGKFTRTYTPKNTVNYETLVKQEYIAQENKYFGDKPLRIIIRAYFEIPKSFSKEKKDAANRNEIWPTKKPDYDNIAKVITDALNGIAYDDDKQVVSAVIDKYYSDRPRVEFWVYENTPF